jgi:hypothetical protein
MPPIPSHFQGMEQRTSAVRWWLPGLGLYSPRLRTYGPKYLCLPLLHRDPWPIPSLVAPAW